LAYVSGRGVARDDRLAFTWFEKAANNGLPLAQYAAGMAYANGRGQEPDGVKAHVWLSLAVAGGYVGAAQSLDAVASRLQEGELARARELARQWRPSSAQSSGLH